jgi:putative DNA primase/helicase
MRWSYDEVLQEFIRHLEAEGIPPHDPAGIKLDGRSHYYRIAGQKGKKGYYKVYFDEHPGGSYKSFRGDVEFTRWAMAGRDEGLDAGARRVRAEEWARERERREAGAGEERARAIRKARTMWEASTPADPAQAGRYLARKGLAGGYGERQFGGNLIIPLTDGSEVMTAQTISPDGTKLFVAGAPKAGHFFHIPRGKARKAELFRGGGEDTEAARQLGKYLAGTVAFLCEGFATGATLHELTGWDVICAIDAGNLLPVAGAARRLHPDWTLVVAPDWDRAHGNTGVAAGMKAADEFGLAMAPPPFGDTEEGSDWNDLFTSRGRAAARTALASALKAAFADPGLPARELEHLFPDTAGESGRPKGTITNLECLLRHLGIKVRYNVIRKETEYSVPGKSFGMDNALNAALAWITSECVRHGYPKSEVDSYLTCIAAMNYYNPVTEWMQSREWDGVARMDQLIDTIECPPEYPDDLKTALLSKWLVSAAAAAAMPDGFKTRGVLVLQGEQSIGKTFWLRSLCPEGSRWFFEGQTMDPANKDILKEFVSHWIVELGELEGTLKKTDIARLKSFITKDTDTVRLPWARKMSEFPRHTVLCASVNQREVLFDLTGNTRWWVIPCVRTDYRHGLDMQQVWAEALRRFTDGEEWWLSPEEERRLEEQNRSFEAVDPVQELLASRLCWDDPESLWAERTATEILMEIGFDYPTRAQCTSASLYLRKMGAKPGTRNNRARLILAPLKRLGT